MAQESMVTKSAHRCAAARAYGITMEHEHAQAVLQEGAVMEPIKCLCNERYKHNFIKYCERPEVLQSRPGKLMDFCEGPCWFFAAAS